MVSGIDSEGLTNLSNNTKQYYLDLEEYLSDLKDEFEQICNNYEGRDLQFLYNDLTEQINQLDIIDKKIESYFITFDDIIIGYKNQETEIAGSVNLYLNNQGG